MIPSIKIYRWQAIIWTNADPIHWRIYAAPGADELIRRNFAKPYKIIEMKLENTRINGRLTL